MGGCLIQVTFSPVLNNQWLVPYFMGNSFAVIKFLSETSMDLICSLPNAWISASFDTVAAIYFLPFRKTWHFFEIISVQHSVHIFLDPASKKMFMNYFCTSKALIPNPR